MRPDPHPPAAFQGWTADGDEAAVRVPLLEGMLDARLWTPPHAAALVIIAQPTVDSCSSWRERFVANALARVGITTLLVDLLQAGETRGDVEVPQLAARLTMSTRWLRSERGVGHLPLGYLGVGAGAAAAFVAASLADDDVRAIVSRSGRPDFAGAALLLSRAPALFIVGGDDELQLAANRAACGRSAKRVVEVIPSVDALVDGEDLARVTLSSVRWFSRWLN